MVDKTSKRFKKTMTYMYRKMYYNTKLCVPHFLKEFKPHNIDLLKTGERYC